MVGKVITQHVASVPGYQKIYFSFSKPTTGLERLIVDALQESRYIGGKEPKYSLYVGNPEPQVIEGAVARQWTPSYKKFSWNRFWAELRAENRMYTLECRCGVWNKSDKVYNRHKKHCSVMQEFRRFLARIENSKTYQEWLEHESKSKRKTKKRSKTSAKSRKPRGKSTSKETKQKLQRRKSRKH